MLQLSYTSFKYLLTSKKVILLGWWLLWLGFHFCFSFVLVGWEERPCWHLKLLPTHLPVIVPYTT